MVIHLKSKESLIPQNSIFSSLTHQSFNSFIGVESVLPLHIVFFNSLKLPWKNINKQLLCAVLAGKQLFVIVSQWSGKMDLTFIGAVMPGGKFGKISENINFSITTKSFMLLNRKYEYEAKKYQISG